MKKILAYLLGILLLSNFGCSNNESKLVITNSGNSNSAISKVFTSGPLFGKWSEKDSVYTHNMEFKEDGILTIEYGQRKFDEKYKYITENEISNTDKDGKVRFVNYYVKRDELTLTWTDAVVKNKSQHFIRVKK